MSRLPRALCQSSSVDLNAQAADNHIHANLLPLSLVVTAVSRLGNRWTSLQVPFHGIFASLLCTRCHLQHVCLAHICANQIFPNGKKLVTSDAALSGAKACVKCDKTEKVKLTTRPGQAVLL